MMATMARVGTARVLSGVTSAVLGTALLVPGLVSALPTTVQTCDTSRYPLSSPTALFDDHHDGTVTDSRANLMWLRCPLGQKWLDGRCTGAARLVTWDEALAASKDVNREGAHFFGDWRLPKIHELATIAERQCKNPRINLTVFPATPAAAFWSSTSRASTTPDNAAFVLSFGPEGVQYEIKEGRHYVRLVRSGP